MAEPKKALHPLSPNATQAEIIDAVNDVQVRLVEVEKDDAVVHSWIQKVGEFLTQNPVFASTLKAAIIAGVTALGLYIAARNNSMPGIQSEPTPPAAKSVPEPKTAPAPDKLEQLQKNLKEKQ